MLCLGFLERSQLQNSFTILPGDRYDAVISASILEHWYNVLQGKAVWSEVKYYFPYSRTIAQTDAYFLIGLAYAPFRVFGLDPFISQEFAGLVIKSIGFFGAFFLTRKSFGFSFWFAVLAATLFTMSNGMTSHSSRLQLSTVALAPFVGFLLWNSLSAFWREDSRGFLTWGIATAVAFGAWCLTCFYMAWFFAFYNLLLFGVLLALMRKEMRAEFFEKAKKQHFNLYVVIAFGIMFLLPFAWAFLPKSLEVGVRTYEMVFSNTVVPEAILQVGKSNLLYGALYNNILTKMSPTYAPNGEYYNVGFAPALFFIFVGGFFIALKNRFQHVQSLFVFAFALTTMISIFLLIKLYGFSAWFIVYSIMPGAKALNAISTFLIFLALPLIVVSVYYLQCKKLPSYLLWFVVAILIVGEINTPELNLVRDSENQRIALPELPPDECKAFYVSGWNNQEEISGFANWINAYYAHNVTTMMIAQEINIPTVNGIASFNQPDWNFGFPNNFDYEDRVMNYVKKHNISGLCQLDLNSKKWAMKLS